MTPLAPPLAVSRQCYGTNRSWLGKIDCHLTYTLHLQSYLLRFGITGPDPGTHPSPEPQKERPEAGQ